MQKFHLSNAKVLLSTFLIMFSVAFFSSCEEEEGKGGTSTIKGTVLVQEYNSDFTIKVGDPYPAQEVDVFLIYGNDEVHSDRFKTGWDGKFEFNYLKKGKYMVYVLSKDISNPLTKEKIPVSIEMEITDKDQVLDTGELNIID